MAGSDSYNYNRTAAQIITEAYELAGLSEVGESMPSEDVTTCLASLNMMVKAWQAEGIGLWKNVNASLFPSSSGYEYSIGPTSTDHCTASHLKTEIATAIAASGTSLVVDSVTGVTDTFDRDGIITATTPGAQGAITLDGTLVTSSVATLPSQREVLVYSDADDSGVTFTVVGTDNAGASVTEVITGPSTTTVYSTSTFKTVTSCTISGAGTGNIEVGCVGPHVGIELDSGAMQWTWAAAALTTTITLADGATSAAAVDNHVYIYNEEIQRPLEISNVTLQMASGYERPLNLITRDEYKRLPNKTDTGSANCVYYEPLRTNGKMSVWLACSDVQEYIKFTARIPIEDFDASTEDPDFPQEWLLALSWNLAVLIAPKFEKVLSQQFEAKAFGFKKLVSEFDREQGSVYFQVGGR